MSPFWPSTWRTVSISERRGAARRWHVDSLSGKRKQHAVTSLSRLNVSYKVYVLTSRACLQSFVVLDFTTTERKDGQQGKPRLATTVSKTTHHRDIHDAFTGGIRHSVYR